MKRLGVSRAEKVFIILAIIVLILGSVNIAKAQGKFLLETGTIPIYDNKIDLDDLSVEQKIGQMIIVAGQNYREDAWRKLGVGGIHMYARSSADAFKSDILSFQKDMAVPYFVSADLEGCLNPLGAFYQSTSAASIYSPGSAFEKGVDDGRALASLGFTFNFAPVVDLEDSIWGCRTFPGTVSDQVVLAQSYILGLQNEGIIATAKHYPGKALAVSDPHKFMVSVNIEDEDIQPYFFLFQKGDVQAVMVTHVISKGVVNSHGVPSVVDPEVISEIRSQFDGLIVTDEIMMLGLRNFYPSTQEMYVAVFKAGSDVVLNFNEDPYEIEHMISTVSSAVRSGEISISRIDASVARILRAKGFDVIQ